MKQGWGARPLSSGGMGTKRGRIFWGTLTRANSLRRSRTSSGVPLGSSLLGGPLLLGAAYTAGASVSTLAAPKKLRRFRLLRLWDMFFTLLFSCKILDGPARSP